MVTVNENNVKDLSNQSDHLDEGAAQPSEADEKPTDEKQAAKPPVAEKPTATAQESGDSMEAVMNLYEESFKRFAEGEVVTGRIISVDKDHVLVDIGYKSEGQIRIQEFKEDDGNISAQVGDTVEVMVEWWDDEDERVVLSKEKASNIKIWDAIKKCYDEDGTI